jgi:hypothetical protein
MKTILVSFILLIAKATYADMTCVRIDVVRCPCAASMSVDCDKYGVGRIFDEQKVKSVTLMLERESGSSVEFTVKNPGLGVRMYHGGAEEDPKVLATLKAMGIDLLEGDTITLKEFIAFSNTKLYADYDATTVLKPNPKHKRGQYHDEDEEEEN